MKNWKTTVFGILTSVGLLLVNSNSPVLHGIGIAASALGGLGIGASAKDKNVTGGTVQQ